MPGLLAPGWLWGLTALLVPVAIHLLSRGSSPRLRLGTLRFLEGAETRTVRRLRLTERSLLAARCAILALLALILAEPFEWREPRGAGSGRGLLLIDPALAAGGLDDALGELVTERRSLGWKVSILQDGLPLLPESMEPELVDPSGGELWSLAREAVWREAPGAPVELVTASRVAAVSGTRPRLPEDASWRIWRSEEAEGVNRWIERAGSGIDEAGALIATSRPSGTSYRQAEPGEITEAPGSAPGEVELSLLDGGSVEADDRLRLARPAKPVRVAIVAAAGRELDRLYLETALETLSEVVPVPLALVPEGGDESSVELLFWLSDEPPTADAWSRVADRGALVADGGGRWEECSSEVRAGAIAFEVRRCAAPGLEAAADSGAQTLWALSDGRALLTSTAGPADVRTYAFSSRFRPDWSSLVLSPAYLEWLRELVMESGPALALRSSATAASDRSTMAPSFFEAARAQGPFPRRREADRAWQWALWAMLLAALVTERLLAGYGWRPGGSSP